jgi:hypothetical protein
VIGAASKEVISRMIERYIRLPKSEPMIA